MATSTFPTLVTGVTVQTTTAGALSGDGSSGNKLAVGVDGVTVDVNGSDQLEALGAAVAFKTIAVAGQSNIVADAKDDTLTIAAGSGVTLTTNAGTDTLTIAASGGGGTPADPSGSLQWNDSGMFGAVTGSSVSNALLGGTVGFSTLQSTNGFAMTVPAPSLPTTAPSLAGAGAGNVDNGAHRYKFTWLTTHGETVPSAASAIVTVVNKAANGQVTVPIPTYGQEGTFPLSLNIYRTLAGGSVYKLVSNDVDFSSAFLDNVADVNLGVIAPTVSTAIESGYIVRDDGVLAAPSAPAFGTVLRLGIDETISPLAWIVPETKPGLSGAGLTISGGFPADDADFKTGGSVSILGGLGNAAGTPGFDDGGSISIAPGPGAANGSLHLQDGTSTDRLLIGPTGTITLTPATSLTLNGSVSPASSGTRFLCISTAGVVTSSAVACAGT